MQSYKAFVDEVDSKTLENPAKDLVGGFILGDSDFVDWVKETFLSKRNDEDEIPQLKRLKPRVTVNNQDGRGYLLQKGFFYSLVRRQRV